MKKSKERIDILVVERGLAETRQKAQALIMAGSVLSDGVVIDKAGKEVKKESVITLKDTLPFVSRGGIKLAGALDDFKINVDGLTVMDIGASTGGFTDCALKRGAKKVYAVDVGKSLLDIKLRNDPRVHIIEEQNIRYMAPDKIGEKVDLVTIDVSFISLEKILPKAKEFLKDGGGVLALIKPQFEVGKGQVGKGGIVKDAARHAEVTVKIRGFSEETGFNVAGEAESKITGAKGNKEFWIYLTL
ncbi:MAG: TlyA family RNA methyltransferase [Deltaproteobacteria bacterium]|nr:TlyA family RNA methyltransferase [Deltaproteobacteria bacterium]